MNYRLAAAGCAAALTLATLPLFSGQAYEHNSNVTYVRAVPQDVRVAHVRISDLNLQDASAQATLKGRIRGAARTVCDYSPRRMQLVEAQDIRICVRTAYAGGIEQMVALVDKGVTYAERGGIAVSAAK